MDDKALTKIFTLIAIVLMIISASSLNSVASQDDSSDPFIELDLASDGELEVGQDIDFDLDSSTGMKYFWIFGDRNEDDSIRTDITYSSDEDEPSHVFNSEGVYRVVVFGKKLSGEHEGEFVNDTLKVEITGGEDPTASISFDPSRSRDEETGVLDKNVGFEAENDDNIDQYKWVYGDGNESSWSGSTSELYTYSSTGTYTVELRVRRQLEDGSTYKYDKFTRDLKVVKPPEVGDDSVDIDEDNTAYINVLSNDNDPDGSIDLVEICGGPDHGSADLLNNDQIRYEPDNDFNGEDSFTYRVVDADGAVSETAEVSIDVHAVNDAPRLEDDDIDVIKNKNKTENILSNDHDIDGSLNKSSLSISTEPSHGNASITSDHLLKYEPENNYTGGDSLEYTISDNEGKSSEAEVFIDVSEPSYTSEGNSKEINKIYYDGDVKEKRSSDVRKDKIKSDKIKYHSRSNAGLDVAPSQDIPDVQVWPGLSESFHFFGVSDDNETMDFEAQIFDEDISNGDLSWCLYNDTGSEVDQVSGGTFTFDSTRDSGVYDLTLEIEGTTEEKNIEIMVSQDDDHDGLPNAYEEEIYNTSVSKEDTDSDGIPDPVESFNMGEHNTDPTAMDTDGDMLTDLEEIMGSKASCDTDPNVADCDGDGLLDGEENYRRTFSIDKRYNMNKNDEVVLDVDVGDESMVDEIELRYGVSNNTEGIGSLTLEVPGGNDLSLDGSDQKYFYKSTVLETNEVDGSWTLELPDENGILEQFAINVRMFTDPKDSDTDGDGLSDLEEIRNGTDGYRTNPNKKDTDGDGINDGMEYEFNSDPTLKDSDADGTDDNEEVFDNGASKNIIANMSFGEVRIDNENVFDKYTEYFEDEDGDGELPDGWTMNGEGDAGINDPTEKDEWTQVDETYLYTRHNSVNVTSPVYDLGEEEHGHTTLNMTIKRGWFSGDGTSEAPDADKDFRVLYKDEEGDWNEVARYPGGGDPGEEIQLDYLLPEDAIHDDFRVRFNQTHGVGCNYDYWHVKEMHVRGKCKLQAMVHYESGGEEETKIKNTILTPEVEFSLFNPDRCIDLDYSYFTDIRDGANRIYIDLSLLRTENAALPVYLNMSSGENEYSSRSEKTLDLNDDDGITGVHDTSVQGTDAMMEFECRGVYQPKEDVTYFYTENNTVLTDDNTRRYSYDNSYYVMMLNVSGLSDSNKTLVVPSNIFTNSTFYTDVIKQLNKDNIDEDGFLKDTDLNVSKINFVSLNNSAKEFGKSIDGILQGELSKDDYEDWFIDKLSKNKSGSQIYEHDEGDPTKLNLPKSAIQMSPFSSRAVDSEGDPVSIENDPTGDRTYLYRTYGRLMEVDGIIDEIKDILGIESEDEETLTSGQPRLMYGFGDLADNVGDVGSSVSEGLEEGVNYAKDIGEGGLNTIVGGSKAVFNAGSTAAKKFWDEAKNTVVKLKTGAIMFVGGCKKMIEKAGEAMKDFGMKIAGTLKSAAEAVKDAVEKVVEVLNAIFEYVKRKITQALDVLINTIQSISDKLLESYVNFLESVVEVVKDESSSNSLSSSKILNEIQFSLSDVIKPLMLMIKSIIANLVFVVTAFSIFLGVEVTVTALTAGISNVASQSIAFACKEVVIGTLFAGGSMMLGNSLLDVSGTSLNPIFKSLLKLVGLSTAYLSSIVEIGEAFLDKASNNINGVKFFIGLTMALIGFLHPTAVEMLQPLSGDELMMVDFFGIGIATSGLIIMMYDKVTSNAQRAFGPWTSLAEWATAVSGVGSALISAYDHSQAGDWN